MTNKEIINEVNAGFAGGDSEKILSYLAGDVLWEVPGTFSHVGIDAFREELNNGTFEGLPVIKIKNEIAEGDYVGIEGELQCRKKNGGTFDAFFFDLYRLENGKIKELRSYVVEKNRKA